MPLPGLKSPFRQNQSHLTEPQRSRTYRRCLKIPQNRILLYHPATAKDGCVPISEVLLPSCRPAGNTPQGKAFRLPWQQSKTSGNDFRSRSTWRPPRPYPSNTGNLKAPALFSPAAFHLSHTDAYTGSGRRPENLSSPPVPRSDPAFQISAAYP